MLSLLLMASAGAAECAADAVPDVLVLRSHTYTRIGTCGGLPVYRTPVTDSTFLDRAVADMPLILVTAESVEPTAADDGWPAPRGNLYLSFPFPGDAAQARSAIESVLAGWQVAHAPDVALTVGWDGDYGAHREVGGRFVTGLALMPHGAATQIGLDLHLNATPALYDVLGAADEHVSLATLTGQQYDLDAALWWVLDALHRHASPSPE